jgi:hypothetical protein
VATTDRVDLLGPHAREGLAMTKDEFLSAVRRSRGQWQEAERALTT